MFTRDPSVESSISTCTVTRRKNGEFVLTIPTSDAFYAVGMDKNLVSSAEDEDMLVFSLRRQTSLEGNLSEVDSSALNWHNKLGNLMMEGYFGPARSFRPYSIPA